MSDDIRYLRIQLDELLDKLVATLIDHGPLVYRAIHPQENEVREIMARVIGPAFMRPKIEGALGEAMLKRAKLSLGSDSRFITMDRRTWIECAEEVVQLENKYADVNNWAMEQQDRADSAEAEVQALPEYFHQSGKPLKKIYIGVDRAHDKGDETCGAFTRKNDDGSITILAELRGEAAEYVAELESNYNDLSHHYSYVLEHATGGKMSKTNYTKEEMYLEIDGHIQDLCDEAVKELKDSLPKKTLRWDGERRDGEGAYVCIYCDVQLPRFGAIVHKADCIQATMF